MIEPVSGFNLIRRPQRFDAAATYNAAADRYDQPPLSFWDRHGRRTVECLGLRAGQRVLDVGCGSGASALPAARAVGPSGSVLGLDVAENMLALALGKALEQGLDNVRFEHRDMLAHGLPDASFDAVISGFSVFFVEDMVTLVQRLWRLLRPGGQLAITTWQADAFQPLAGVFENQMKRVCAHRPARPDPWQRLSGHAELEELFRAAGVAMPVITDFDDWQPLGRVRDAWIIAMGSGYRSKINSLDLLARAQLRVALASDREMLGCRRLATGAICAIAAKPV